jgi:hypothetical protein
MLAMRSGPAFESFYLETECTGKREWKIAIKTRAGNESINGRRKRHKEKAHHMDALS